MAIVSLDIEGAFGAMRPSVEGFYTSCVGIVNDEGDEHMFWFEHNEQPMTRSAIRKIQRQLDEAELMVGHNLKYDLVALKHYGLKTDHLKIWDTMVAEYLLSGQAANVRKFSLDAVAEYHGVGMKEGDVVRQYWDNGVQTKDIPSHILAEYQIRDCWVAMWVYQKQLMVAQELDMVRLIELQCEFTLCLIDMEYNGLVFDEDLAEEIYQKYKDKAGEIQQKIRDHLGYQEIDMSSLIQRSAVIYGGLLKLRYRKWVVRELKVRPESTYTNREIREEHEIKGLGFPKPSNPRKRNKNGYFKVDHPTIADLPANTAALKEWKRLLIDYATYSKIHQTLKGKSYLTGLMRKVGTDGKIHPELKQTRSKTGRLTSENPNGQNLFTAIKILFKPSLDKMGQYDLSQVEWRVAGELSDDQVIIDEVNGGVDQHVETCRHLMELPFKDKKDPESKQNRNHAKVFNFRMIFGGSFWGFHLDINMPDFGVKKWKRVIKKFFQKYWRLEAWHNQNIREVLRTGRLSAPTGRWWQFFKVVEEEGEKTYSQNQIKNYPVQGVAGGDLLPLTAVIIRRGMVKMGLKSKMVLTVHDSIVFDIAKGEEDRLKDLCLKVGSSLREYIQSYFGIPWRIYLEGEFEIGYNYAELYEVTADQTCQGVLDGIRY
jgi:DNA polymerase I-like protein with 3'-5' exonuclease and polymerase domains